MQAEPLQSTKKEKTMLLDIEEQILKTYEKESKTSHYRPNRLGASLISSTSCQLRMWLNYRWAREEETPNDILRLKSHGKLFEEKIIGELRRCGYIVHSEDNNKKQFEKSYSKNIVYKADGIIIGIEGDEKTPHLLEVKGLKEEGIDKLFDKRLKKAYPWYYKQCQIGMFLFDLSACVFIASSKNGDRIYSERILKEAGEAEELVQIGHGAITSKLPPSRGGDTILGQPCLFCDYKQQCWTENQKFGQYRVVEKNCRSCRHFLIDENNLTICALKDEKLTFEQQLVGCENYRILNEIVPHELIEETEVQSVFLDLNGDTVVQVKGHKLERVIC